MRNARLTVLATLNCMKYEIYIYIIYNYIYIYESEYNTKTLIDYYL